MPRHGRSLDGHRLSIQVRTPYLPLSVGAAMKGWGVFLKEADWLPYVDPRLGREESVPKRK